MGTSRVGRYGRSIHPLFPPVVAVILGLLLGAAALPADEAVRSIAPVVNLSLRVPAPPLPVKWKGQETLAYELHIGDYRLLGLELTQVQILADGPNGRVLASYQGAALAVCLRPPDIKTPDHLVFIWVLLRPSDPIPGSLYHRVTFRFPESGECLVREGAHTVIDPLRRCPVLSPPVLGSGWAAGNGPQNQDHHHRWSLMTLNGEPFIAQRFGVDWLQFGPSGRFYETTGATNDDWYCYGLDLLAVADGTVVDIKDGIPENTPFAPPVITINSQTAGGNYVLLDIGDGFYAFYAHLIPGSHTVRIGDHVVRGQKLGRLGNTGASTGPHLHFHVCTSRDPLFSQGVPYSFDRYFLQGTCVEDEPWYPAGHGELRVDELPAGMQVVEFID